MSYELLYDFSELPDGPHFPEGISVGILRTDGPVAEVIAEPTPDAYYYVQDGCGVFAYTEDIAGSQVDRRGLLALPGVLEGRDADLSIIFVNPFSGFHSGLPSATFQLGLGYRSRNSGLEWIGGLMESYWTGGAWLPKWRLSIVRIEGATVNYLETLETDAAYNDSNDLTVRVKDSGISVGFNGIHGIQAESDFHGESSPVIWAKALLDGNPAPLIEQIQAVSLESGIRYPIHEIPGYFLPPPIGEPHFVGVPVIALEKAGKLKRIGHNAWQFTEAVLVERPGGNNFKATPGAIIEAPRMTLEDAETQACRFVFSEG